MKFKRFIHIISSDMIYLLTVAVLYFYWVRFLFSRVIFIARYVVGFTENICGAAW